MINKHHQAKFIWLAVLGTLITVGLVAIVWFMVNLQPVSSQAEKVKFVVKPGSASREIANQLYQEKLIKSPYVFLFLVWKNNLSQQLQAGSFTLSPSMSPQDIALNLTKGTEDVWVTIKEGWRATQIGEYLAGILPSFDPSSEEFKVECLDYEGYLFPETYLVPTQYSTTQMCRLMRQQFEEVITDEWQQAINNSPYSLDEIVTLASIIQREAKSLEDMKIVAGILYNRLDLNMALQVDATLQYIQGSNQGADNWWPTPQAIDKQLDSPYNTYTNPGLPPGPISNPGSNALEAAIYPTPNDNLYYISDSQGENMHFSKTYPEHLENINLYLR